ncbi:MAG: class I SAM-dependent methyltransferase [Candidatus Tectomicrobia bacterium]|uniref:Class I SAM-dependent methyltransferase n=1 Tax=Tectimicrobiota bacterium TaxID=2528274 RepID=A0A933GJA1_UNCTE|nr:class I SAM-dependent methyltransferase [Candidatus Tectomicrobia bacterium]
MAQVFAESKDSVESKLDNFPIYVRRQKLTRLLSLYEIFKRVLHVKGSIVECGVYNGFGLMSFANMSAVLEPNNLTRRIYGFDTFEGFPSITDRDRGALDAKLKRGDFHRVFFEDLQKLIGLYDKNRFLGHVNKVQLVVGDATKTIPEFVQQNPHLVVSLLFMDFDLFEPTKVALETFYPRMPKGAIIAFDELDNPLWPGETIALLKTIGINNLKLSRFPFDPYIGYAIL